MGYRDNVDKLAADRGIPNPLEDKDIAVSGMTYWTSEGSIIVDASSMNRVIRLFLQSRAEMLKHPATGALPGRLEVDDGLLAAAAEFFSELWDHEPGLGTHKNLDALRAAKGRIVELHWW